MPKRDGHGVFMGTNVMQRNSLPSDRAGRAACHTRCDRSAKWWVLSKSDHETASRQRERQREEEGMGSITAMKFIVSAKFCNQTYRVSHFSSHRG